MLALSPRQFDRQTGSYARLAASSTLKADPLAQASSSPERKEPKQPQLRDGATANVVIGETRDVCRVRRWREVRRKLGWHNQLTFVTVICTRAETKRWSFSR